MRNKEKESTQDKLEENGQAAYNIIKAWIKNIPITIEDIKANGTKEDLHNYQIQIKMVLDKLEDIVKDMKTSD
ncbi:uncharacterized protein METZ01_LOCUS107152 [marine metagenome]|jgi:RNAse (barnase) inhibitor barstar|uniref:Uncharacterized protein n=1 Tax=marine metagenome TaxID=408172 RepID=A0A381WQ15_9ZZZZ|tara:strand:+ start:394 stop:612 length:219 start_codon:yes stop_codon:yes gene_type:complete